MGWTPRSSFDRRSRVGSSNWGSSLGVGRPLHITQLEFTLQAQAPPPLWACGPQGGRGSVSSYNCRHVNLTQLEHANDT